MGGIVLKSRLTAERSAHDLSVVIITLNEEINLTRLLPEIPKGAEIILVDSGSSDNTVALAKSWGARVEVRPFDNYSAQKNYALSLATRPWTLSLDADERPDQTLWAEILEILRGVDMGGEIFALQRRLVFLGTKLFYGRSRDYVTRLFKTKTAHYENEIHEELKYSSHLGRPKVLKGTLWHWSYRDLDDYFTRFNRYTNMMAKSRFDQRKPEPSSVVLVLRLPVDFAVRYIFKLGFLDGWHGFLWALLGSIYGFVKYVKLKELYRESKMA